MANLFLGLQCFAGLAVEVDWFETLFSLAWATNLKTLQMEECFQRECQGVTLSAGKKQKKFSSFFLILSEASSLCVRDEVFWTEDLIKETTKGLHYSYTILTFIEHDMSAQLNCSLPNLVPQIFVSYYTEVYTCWLSERRRREWGGEEEGVGAYSRLSAY